MRGKGSEAMRSDVMAEESDLLLHKNTFVGIDVEAIFRKDGKDCFEVRKVLGAGLTENEDVV
jgi:hypothetical protein